MWDSWTWNNLIPIKNAANSITQNLTPQKQYVLWMDIHYMRDQTTDVRTAMISSLPLLMEVAKNKHILLIING